MSSSSHRKTNPPQRAAARHVTRWRQRLVHGVLWGLLAWLPNARSAAAGAIQFEDVTPKTGIHFVHSDGGSGQYYIIEYVSCGLALLDYNHDGLIDIFFLNGAPLKGTLADAPPLPALYRNNGDGTFTDVTVAAGLAHTSYGLGVAVADYDNDGNPDLYINNFGPNILYHNNGDGTFTEATASAGVADSPDHTGAGVCFLDLDGDGNLDLFVGHYIRFSYGAHVLEKVAGLPVYTGPHAFPSSTNVLFRNQGDGTFADISMASGIAAHPGSAMGVMACDYNQDGHTDIFVANDRDQNFLYQNDGTGHFEQNGLTAGIAYNLSGEAHGNMAMEFADYDNDGWLDLYITSYQDELPLLFRNLGQGLFKDVTRISGAGAGTFAKVKWAEGFTDFDNDGWRDLFVVCGNLQPNVEKYDDRYSYLQKHVLLRNTGQSRFVDVTAQAGEALQVPHCGRGAGFDDLDNDGRVDVVILNSRAAPTVLRNVSPNAGHWLQVQLRGVKTNRDGVGAQVKLTAGTMTLVDEVHSGRSYQSHYGSRLYFGLGAHPKVDRLEVRWIGGGTDVYQDIASDQLIQIVEGHPLAPAHPPSAPK